MASQVEGADFVYIIKIPLLVENDRDDLDIHLVQVGVVHDTRFALMKRLYEHRLGWHFATGKSLGLPTSKSSTSGRLAPSKKLAKRYPDLVGVIQLPQPSSSNGSSTDSAVDVAKDVEDAIRDFVGAKARTSMLTAYLTEPYEHTGQPGRVWMKTKDGPAGKYGTGYFSPTEVRVVTSRELSELRKFFKRSWKKKKAVRKGAFFKFSKEVARYSLPDVNVTISGKYISTPPSKARQKSQDKKVEKSAVHCV